MSIETSPTDLQHDFPAGGFFVVCDVCESSRVVVVDTETLFALGAWNSPQVIAARLAALEVNQPVSRCASCLFVHGNRPIEEVR